MEDLLKKLLNHEDINFEGSRDMIDWIMSDQGSTIKASALLVLLQAKGATVEEIAGAATAFRAKSIRVRAPENAIDTCSTGGNGISTFNISTCAAIIAAAGGAVVAKHGNRSNTRKSGSAEVLQALGVNIELDLKQVEACVEEIGICFCYAVNHHPAMRFAIPIRKELGIPTIFNILGPLGNPAAAKNQIIGVPQQGWTKQFAEVLKQLGSNRVMVFTGADGLCELTTTADTYISELRDGEIRHYTVTPEELGLKRGNLDDIRISSPEESARIIEKIFVGEEQGTARDIALLNSAAALVVGGVVDDLKTGLAKAAEAVDSGKAIEKLKSLVDFTRLPQHSARSN
ncbi:MAG: anthranilate phosphoribosyltransferase [SAR324 cluster bacterium]|nr:anthranilate phosphoribosyltransferase [SAR324 cluster bacterium]